MVDRVLVHSEPRRPLFCGGHGGCAGGLYTADRPTFSGGLHGRATQADHRGMSPAVAGEARPGGPARLRIRPAGHGGDFPVLLAHDLLAPGGSPRNKDAAGLGTGGQDLGGYRLP